MVRPPSLKLSHYFLLEGVNAFCATFFLFCMFFWTEKKFGYSITENLLLTAVHGLTYIFAARYGGRLADRIGYDRMLSICTFALGVILILCSFPTWRGTPFVAALLYTVFMGPTWPSLEAASIHSVGSTSMPNRLGFYNITWALGDALGFAVSALFFDWSPDSILWVPGCIHLMQWIFLQTAPRQTDGVGEAAMEFSHSGDDVPREIKRRFMHTAWLANALGFLMLAGLSTLTPQIGRDLSLPARLMIWLGCTQLFSRTIAFVIFWKWEAWHYHKGWSLCALWVAPFLLSVVFFVHHPLIVFVALAGFGMAVGLSYSGSLYYSLDYGKNKGEHGGLHEAILGIGVFVGPLLAGFVSYLGGKALGAEYAIIAVTVVGNVVGLAWIARLNRAAR